MFFQKLLLLGKVLLAWVVKLGHLLRKILLSAVLVSQRLSLHLSLRLEYDEKRKRQLGKLNGELKKVVSERRKELRGHGEEEESPTSEEAQPENEEKEE